MATTQTHRQQARAHRKARTLDRDALRGRRRGMGRGRGGSRGPRAARREGAVRSRMGGDRLRVRPGAAAHRQEPQRAGELRPDGRGPRAGQDRLRSRLPADAASGGGQAEERSGGGDGGAAAGRPVDLARSPHRRGPGRCRAQLQRHGARGRRAEGPAREARLRRGARRPHRRPRHVVRLQPGQQVGDDEVRADLVAGDARHPRARVRLAGRRRAAADADHRSDWSPRRARSGSAPGSPASRSGR